MATSRLKPSQIEGLRKAGAKNLKDAPELMVGNLAAAHVLSMLLVAPPITETGHLILHHEECFALMDRYDIQEKNLTHEKVMLVFETLNKRRSEDNKAREDSRGDASKTEASAQANLKARAFNSHQAAATAKPQKWKQ